jgi:hypothetical protein
MFYQDDITNAEGSMRWGAMAWIGYIEGKEVRATIRVAKQCTARLYIYLLVGVEVIVYVVILVERIGLEGDR